MLRELYIEVRAAVLALLRVVAKPPTRISVFGVRVPSGAPEDQVMGPTWASFRGDLSRVDAAGLVRRRGRHLLAGLHLFLNRLEIAADKVPARRASQGR